MNIQSGLAVICLSRNLLLPEQTLGAYVSIPTVVLKYRQYVLLH
jgi:hypothetical protein